MTRSGAPKKSRGIVRNCIPLPRYISGGVLEEVSIQASASRGFRIDRTYLLWLEFLAGFTLQTGVVNKTFDPVELARVAYVTDIGDDSSRLNILDGSPADQPQSTMGQSDNTRHHGFVVRNLRRGLQDQKELYAAPFKVKNLKWDALFLGTTGALLATDRQVMRNISNDHVDIGHQLALGMLLGNRCHPKYYVAVWCEDWRPSCR